jgi:hypothetical protein
MKTNKILERVKNGEKAEELQLVVMGISRP